MVDGFLAKGFMLLALTYHCGLISAKDFVGLCHGELLDGDIISVCVLDNNGGSVLAMAKKGSARTGKVETHRLVGAL